MYVTQDSDFVWGNVDVALKLFPNVLNFSFAPIEKKKKIYLGFRQHMVFHQGGKLDAVYLSVFQQFLAETAIGSAVFYYEIDMPKGN